MIKLFITNTFIVKYNCVDALEKPDLQIFARFSTKFFALIKTNFNVLFGLKKYVESDNDIKTYINKIKDFCGNYRDWFEKKRGRNKRK